MGAEVVLISFASIDKSDRKNVNIVGAIGTTEITSSITGENESSTLIEGRPANIYVEL